MKSELIRAEAIAVTSGPKHHFFGYYDKSCWDPTGRWILGLETSFIDHPPKAGDTATIGLIDTQHGNEWKPLAKTHAWNWQQGCMLQWLGTGDSGEIIFNDCKDGAFISRILNIHSMREREIGLPVYSVSRDGTRAVSLNFSRLQHQRPGYGYPGVPDRWANVLEPSDDGLYSIDLKTGKYELILSVAEASAYQRIPAFDGRIHRFNHAQFSPGGKRVAFFHRYKNVKPDANSTHLMNEVGNSRLMTVNLDGSDLYCLSDQTLVSHYDWKDDHSILSWAHRDNLGDHYYFFHDKSAELDVVGEKLFSTDGHCSFSPDGRWVLTDTYPDETDHRTLILFHWESGERVDIGRFYAPPMEWQIRCDLHPRWSRDGGKVCIDSIHEGHRQMYVLDVKEIVSSQ